MKCKICGKKFKHLGLHVKSKHCSNKDYYDKFLKKLGEGECKICGKETKFISLSRGYKKTCSKKCFDLYLKSNEFQKNRKETNLKKYGVDNPWKSEKIREKIKKTNLKRYGVEHHFKNKQIQEKRKQTWLKKYGVDNPWKNKEIMDKIKKTHLKRYGVDNVLKSKEIKEKIKKINLEKYGVDNLLKNEKIRRKFKEKYGVEHPFKVLEIKEKFQEEIKKKALKRIKKLEQKYDFKFIEFEDRLGNEFFKIHCNRCKKEAIGTTNSVYLRVTKEKEFRCLSCIPYQSKVSKYETEIFEFLKNDLEVKNIVRNSKKIISPFEIDIYLPDFNLAIEFNGIYWHSTNYCDKDYHLKKTELCESKRIHLIHIFEHEWINEKDHIKDYLRNLIVNNKEDKNFKPGDRRYHSLLNIEGSFEIKKPFKENFLNFEFWNCGEIIND